MLPSEKYAELLERAKKFMRFGGADFYALEPKTTAFTYFALFYASLYIYLMISTLVQLEPGEWSSLIENINMALTLLQGLVKMYTVYKYGRPLFQAQQWMLETYKEYEAVDLIFRNALTLCTNRLEKIFSYISRSYLGLLVIFEMMPIIADVFLGKKVVLFKFVVPISSPEVAFYVMYGIQALGICVFLFPSLGMDFMFVMYVVQTLMLADIFKMKLACIDEVAKKKSNTTDTKVSSMVRDLVKWHFSICRLLKMLPSEKYAELLERAKKYLRFGGANFYALEPKTTAFTYFALFYASLYIYLMVSTLVQLEPGEWSSLIENVNMALTLLQGLVKMYTVYKYGRPLFQAQQWMLETYKEYEAVDLIFHNALTLCTDRLEKIFSYISRSYIGVLVIFEMMPIIADVFLGKKVVLFKFVVPISSPEVAFYVMYGIQALGISIFFLTSLGGDFMFVMYIVQTLMLADIFKMKLACIDELTKIKSNRTDIKASSMVRNLVKWHFSICRYTKSLQTIFHGQLTTIILTSTVSVSVAILTVFITDWPQGYLMISFSYFGLFIACFLGSVFEEAQNNIRVSLLESNWYLLPIKDQKMFQFMLLRTQYPYVFTALGLIPVCVCTGVQITRTIYSCFMMFLKFVG